MEGIEDIYALSPLQRGLLFHALVEPDAGLYVEQVSWTIEGRLDSDAFRRAWQRVADRHPILRTAFIWEDLDEPVQVVHRRVDLPFEVLDTLDLTADRQRGFDLGTAPLQRILLVRLAADRHLFVWTHHHLLLDGWSVPLVLREVFGFYEAFRRGEELHLPRARPFRDYVDWLQRQDLEAAESYWRRTLAGFTAPTSVLRGGQGGERSGACEGLLPESETAALSSLARAQRLTVNTLVQGAWALLLSRYSGQEDVLWGATVSGRPPEIEGIESMVGLFINTLPLRVAVPPSASLLPWLRDLQAAQAEARRYDYSPLYRVHGWSEVPADQPLFETIVGFENYPVSSRREDAPGDFVLRPGHSFSMTNYPLSLLVMPGEGLEIRILYDGRRFEAVDVERLLGHYRTLLAGMCADPDRPLSALPLLTPEERSALLVDWNATGADFPEDCVHQLVARHAAETPGAPAVRSGAHGLTYEELNRRANRLARHLQSLGVGPEVPVVLFARRSIAWVVAQLAVLKAGGAFVPADPAHPRQRLALMLEDVQPPVVIAEDELIPQLPASAATVIRLGAEEDWDAPDLETPVGPSNLAYVIFTSGSTGRPKGVEIEHRRLSNLVHWHLREYDVTAADRISQLAGPAFDAAVWEVWPALAAGACLTIVDDETRASPAALWRWLAEERITLSFVPTALLEAMLEEPRPAELTLRALLTGGDALHRTPERLPCPLINHYGPTESTVVATCGPVADTPPHIGRPIANLQVYLLDRSLEPVPAGVPGELYIGGCGLARGYLGRPDLTAERFVPDPFGEPGAQLYRTGDLARHRTDGNLDFLGRLDHQVKVRGFRVELGEIEAALERHRGVSQAVVLLREDDPGDRRLVAYVVPQRYLSGNERSSELVEHWRQLYESVYGDQNGEPGFNTVGWHSSYTGLPYSAGEMREWVETTVARIRGLRPRRVLEIGCGTGLLLHRVAPHCEEYLATDFSPAALDQVRRGLAVSGLDHVTLLCRTADDFEGLADGAFDAVILNSVVQYFPSADYLLRVLTGALRVTAPGGAIFVGDVRSLPLVEAFHAAVELKSAPGTARAAALRQRIRRRVAQEQELLLDPAFFQGLTDAVEIHLKRGRCRTEMACFRYDVVLRVGAVGSAPAPAVLDWRSNGLSLPDLRRRLEERQSLPLLVTGVPNARIEEEIAFLAALAEADEDQTLEDLRAGPRNGIEPEDFFALADDLGCDCALTWGAAQGDFDVLLVQKESEKSPACPSKPHPLSPSPVSHPIPRRERGDDVEEVEPVGCAMRTFDDGDGAPSAPYGNPARLSPPSPPGRGAGGEASEGTRLHSAPTSRTPARLANEPFRDAPAITLQELRETLERQLPEAMVPAAFVILDALPVTPNGKVDRAALPPPDRSRLDLAATYAPPSTPAERLLAQTWAAVLKLDQVGVHDNFFELGGDSILGIQIVARARENGLRITPRQIFERPTIAELAAAAGDGAQAEVPAIPTGGPVPLTPIQRWFFERDLPDPHHFNQALLLQVSAGLNERALGEALRRLVDHHDALRLRFRREVGGWEQLQAADSEDVFSVIDLTLEKGQQGHQGHQGLQERQSVLSPAVPDVPPVPFSNLLETQAAELQASFDLACGPLLRAVLFRTGPREPGRLLLVIHHLVVDAVSWRILLEDLVTAYRQLCRGEEVRLPAKTTSFQEWAVRLEIWAGSSEARRELDALLLRGTPPALPLDSPGNGHRLGEAATLTVHLEADATQALLTELPRTYRTQINDVLLAGLAQTLARWTGSRRPWIELEGHGRQPLSDDVDLSRTVGWFTTLCPVVLDLGEPASPGEELLRVKEQLRSLPHQGLAFGALRYLSPDPQVRDALARLPRPWISFNYMGQFGQAGDDSGGLAPAPESAGPSRSARQPRSHPIEVNCEIADGRLAVEWTYSPACHARATIERLAASYLEALRDLLGASRDSDFEALDPLSPQQLGMLLESLHGSGSGLHVEQHVVPLDPGVDLDLYGAAWQRLVDRHPSLRTAFVWKDASEPLQAVLARVRLPFERRDLNGDLEDFLAEDRRRGFDMARPPLMRLTAFRRPDGAPAVIWTHHHILLDGWSLPVLVRELGEIYGALARGEEPTLPPVRPYRDYVVWLGRQDAARAEAFWRQALAGISAPTPLGREDGAIAITNGAFSAHHETVLSRPWPERLQQTALRHRLTLNTLVQGAWALLLGRYSGAGDVVFGTTVSGRPTEISGVESMIGLFINTLPFRIQVPKRADLWDWLRQLQQRHSDLREFEHCSTGQIHSWSGLPGSLPLYESVLVFENYPLTGGDRNGNDSEFSGARTKYPLTLLVSTGPELTVRLVYDPRRLPAESAERIAEHLLRLLRTIAEGDARFTADLAMRIADAEVPWVYPRHAPARSSGLRTATEERLAEIWRELLGVETVGGEDDFLAFGGHSLLATRLVSRVRETFQVDVSLRRFFDAPTLAGLAALIDDLLGETPTTPGGEVTPRPPDANPVPLSFAQERLWFLQQLDPASLVYNVPTAIWFRTPLRPEVLQRSIHEIVRRHEVLRTRCELRDGQPCQVIDPEPRTPLPLVDLSGLPPGAASEEAREIARAEARRPFDLGCGPLLRTLLLRLGPENYALLLTLHHIVCDGWSMAVLERELMEIHRAFAAGEPSPLPPLPVQYADFALWQRRWLQGDVLASHLAYWRGQLADPPPFLALPTDFPRPAAWSFRGAGQQLTLSEALTTDLKALSQREGCTLFMTLLAALKILLFRWTGQGDVLVGTPIAGRNRQSTEGLIGFFINTLVLRTRLAPELTLTQLLARVRDTALGAYAHQDLPFEKLLEELQPERSLGRNPLFQVFFNMLTYDGPAQDLHGSIVDGPPEEALAKFDLTFYLEEVDHRLEVRVVYSTDLFSHDRVREMLRQYEHLLDQIASRPDDLISRYSLVTPAARRLLPDPAEPLAAAEEPPIHELFLQAARRDPDQPAVIERGETWTYAELEAESGRLAALLHARGIDRGDVIAIHGGRSASLVLAMLSVLRAGAAFLLLDPAHPAPRLVSCLRQARPRGWIQISAPSPALGEFVATLPLKIDLTLPQELEPAAPPPVAVRGHDLAYVAFTSGTTGEPRGILGSHAPVSHFLRWHARTFDLRPADRFGMLSGVSHDPLLRDVFTPLSLGATLCVPSPEAFDTPDGLAPYVREQGVTVLHLTPPLGRLLAEPGQTLPTLRYLFFGGDTLRQGLLQDLRPLAPGAACVNFYGTTETPQAMGCHVVEALHPSPDGRLPIGRGIEGCQLLIETTHGLPAGIGEPGEIHVRSPHLCKGFLDDPTDRTDPSDPSDRFPTGDLGRYLPDGTILLAGRADDQLKIRGFRVEPAEVEAALERHPAVRQAAVVAREEPSGENRLVAFVVGEVTAVELQQFVRTALPEPMVPSLVVFAERLPLTANGKVDRRALPAVDDGALQPEPLHVPPRNDVERTLARLWSDLLGLERVGATDHFFGLGGHSLLAVRMLASLRTAFEVELPLRTIFEAPTVAALAAAVERARERGGELLPTIGRISRDKYRIELETSD